MAPLVGLLARILVPVLVKEVVKKAVTKTKEADMGKTLEGAIASKTMWFSAVLAVLGLVEQYQGLLTGLLGADKMGVVLLVVSVVTAALRAVTNSSLKDKA